MGRQGLCGSLFRFRFGVHRSLGRALFTVDREAPFAVIVDVKLPFGCVFFAAKARPEDERLVDLEQEWNTVDVEYVLGKRR